MVRTAMAIEKEIEVAQSIRDAGASGKRNDDHPSSSSGKKHKTSIPRGIRAAGQPGPMTCFHCH